MFCFLKIHSFQKKNDTISAISDLDKIRAFLKYMFNY